MLERDWLMVIALGGVFVLLGIVALLWGRHEEKSYYDAIATRPDAREYLNHSPYRPAYPENQPVQPDYKKIH